MKSFNKIYYGGDYNPDQWPEEVWQEDMRLFKKANINIVTVPVFSWAKLQPSEERYDFEWLDRVLDLAHENGLAVCLATSTAAQPAWMSKKYPDMLPVNFNGQRRKHGGRVNFCPNHPKYRELSSKLAGEMARRYGKHTALAVWHIGNEYDNYCYCEHCEKEFRKWAERQYKTIENLNKKWNMSFWGHTVYDWDEIFAPSGLCEMWVDSIGVRTTFQPIVLDYFRFMSDSILGCYMGEYEAIKKFSADIPVTTNFMGAYKPLDYFKWARHLDVISWDNYPALDARRSDVAFRHDLMRGLKNGDSFMLMEQTPSQTNWSAYNSLKRPGMLRLWSYQAIARGADTVMYFQMRRSAGACEKFHSAVIDHVGHENTRVFRECAQLGEELEGLGGRFIGARLAPKAAILFDWENWWAVELSSGPHADLKYIPQIEKYYKAFYDANIPVDIVNTESDFSEYKIIAAPLLYMLKPGTAQKLEAFVREGGLLVGTFFSGLVDQNDLVTLGGYPGELRRLFGIWVEEIDSIPPGRKSSMEMCDDGSTYQCGMLCDILHPEGARELARYGKDFYAGKPVLTVNEFGCGRAYYIASDPEEKFVEKFIVDLCREAGMAPLAAASEGVEITQRYKEGFEYTFLLNHNEHAVEVKMPEGEYLELLKNEKSNGSIELEGKGVAILEKTV